MGEPFTVVVWERWKVGVGVVVGWGDTESKFIFTRLLDCRKVSEASILETVLECQIDCGKLIQIVPRMFPLPLQN